jgi:hypothetical protein
VDNLPFEEMYSTVWCLMSVLTCVSGGAWTFCSSNSWGWGQSSSCSWWQEKVLPLFLLLRHSRL